MVNKRLDAWQCQNGTGQHRERIFFFLSGCLCQMRDEEEEEEASDKSVMSRLLKVRQWLESIICRFNPVCWTQIFFLSISIDHSIQQQNVEKNKQIIERNNKQQAVDKIEKKIEENYDGRMRCAHKMQQKRDKQTARTRRSRRRRRKIVERNKMRIKNIQSCTNITSMCCVCVCVDRVGV